VAFLQGKGPCKHSMPHNCFQSSRIRTQLQRPAQTEGLSTLNAAISYMLIQATTTAIRTYLAA
jgi:hypothetical protein